MMMTREEFIEKEIIVWGFDYIADLFDKGYEAVPIRDDHVGEQKWTWLQRVKQPNHLELQLSR